MRRTDLVSPLAAALQAGSVRARGLTVHIVLLLATFYTTTIAGAFMEAGRLMVDLREAGFGLFADPGFLALGLGYSIPLMTILCAHEMGHYVASRHYGVDASLPYFLPGIPIPMPIALGTFGAFIRIRAPFPHRRALFDVGVAGPIAGFVVALPVLVYGILAAQPVAIPESGMSSLGDPLLLTWLSSWLSPVVPEGRVVLFSGPLAAGWVGCLMTGLNLLPIGQLDGGHICYAVSSRFHRVGSLTALAGFIALGLLVFQGWILMAVLLVMIGPRHPPVLDESVELSRGRRLIAALALAMLLACFIPQPFDSSEISSESIPAR